jgi:hypothetical protein
MHAVEVRDSREQLPEALDCYPAPVGMQCSQNMCLLVRCTLRNTVNAWHAYTYCSKITISCPTEEEGIEWGLKKIRSYSSKLLLDRICNGLLLVFDFQGLIVPLGKCP